MMTPKQRIARAEASLRRNCLGEEISVETEMRDRIQAVACKHCILIPEHVVRDMVAYLLDDATDGPFIRKA